MIIKKLRLENFGVYAGPHEIDLMPNSRDEPIVLFGGLNGGGKTTLLDAIQLALFGKLSRCSTRGNLAYEEFLRRCITHGTPTGTGSSVSLEIRQTFDAQTHEFIITRRWAPAGKGVTETLLVQRDNVVDTELAENWLEHVDQFVPVGLAELFFFDGEQIARLAEADNAAQMLTTAINTLLGIDLVDRLEKDLMVYERDVSKTQQNGEFSADVSERERKLVVAQDELKKLLFEKARVQTETDQSQKKVEAIEASYRQQGGDLFARRKQLDAQREAIRVQRDRVEFELREIAAGAAPLLTVETHLVKIRSQALREDAAEHQHLLVKELEKRDRMMAGLLKKGEFPDSARNRLEALFAEDRKRRERAARVERYLNLDKSALQSVQRLTPGFFDDLRKRAAKLSHEHAKLGEQALRIDETLARVPDEAAIAQVAEQLAAAQKELVTRQVESTVLGERIEKCRRQIEDEERALAGLLEKRVAELAENDDASRKIRFAAKVRDTMRQFRIRVLERKIKQIESLILESFQQLLRKKELVVAIKIDPESYRMTLIGANGQELHADRLSAGERQLLAVSTLWGLARASGRPLPTIIDTPLGRLDSLHRANLVENYFPYASHQVIILSTDEEIGKKHLETLRPRITRTFELSYSRKTGATEVVPGYFFN
jgi:DNA sulfur modification protein DndD